MRTILFCAAISFGTLIAAETPESIAAMKESVALHHACVALSFVNQAKENTPKGDVTRAQAEYEMIQKKWSFTPNRIAQYRREHNLLTQEEIASEHDAVLAQIAKCEDTFKEAESKQDKATAEIFKQQFLALKKKNEVSDKELAAYRVRAEKATTQAAPTPAKPEPADINDDEAKTLQMIRRNKANNSYMAAYRALSDKVSEYRNVWHRRSDCNANQMLIIVLNEGLTPAQIDAKKAEYKADHLKYKAICEKLENELVPLTEEYEKQKAIYQGMLPPDERLPVDRFDGVR